MIKHQRDFWAGIMFMVIGGAFAWYASENYALGTAARMGPGYFPFILGSLLFLLGGFVTLTGLRQHDDPDHEIGHFDWDILLLVIGSIILFGFTLNHLGVFIAVPLLVISSSMASHEFSLKIAIGNAIFFSIFTYLVFIKGLGLIFPLWPLPLDEWSVSAFLMIPIFVIIGLAFLYIKITGKRSS